MAYWQDPYPGQPLSQRELDVLTEVANGRSNKRVGESLFISEDTVKTHLRRIYKKLEARDRAQAVAIGIRRGLIE